MRRRTFIAGLGGAAAWPVVARAQQTLPVVAFLAAPPLETLRPYLDTFNQSLKDAGYIDGQNVSIEYRLGGGFNQMPTLAAELVDRQVRVLVAGGGAQVAIKNATTTIPIVSIFAGDPVKSGVVASLNRPGGNVTGVNMLTYSLGTKRLKLLHETVQTAKVIAVLINPNNWTQSQKTRRVTWKLPRVQSANRYPFSTSVANATSSQPLTAWCEKAVARFS
jgi:putative ABC transport system substrate-binding protein